MLLFITYLCLYGVSSTYFSPQNKMNKIKNKKKFKSVELIVSVAMKYDLYMIQTAYWTSKNKPIKLCKIICEINSFVMNPEDYLVHNEKKLTICGGYIGLLWELKQTVIIFYFGPFH